MTYDHWKTTNPADRFLGPEPEEDEERFEGEAPVLAYVLEFSAPLICFIDDLDVEAKDAFGYYVILPHGKGRDAWLGEMEKVFGSCR